MDMNPLQPAMKSLGHQTGYFHQKHHSSQIYGMHSNQRHYEVGANLDLVLEDIPMVRVHTRFNKS